MKQLFLNQGKILLKDTPEPQIGVGEVLVKVLYSFISTGTEVATITSSGPLLNRFLKDVPKYGKKISDSVKENGIFGTVSLIKGKQNQILELGYSCSGQVVSIGKEVSKVKIGDFVACAGVGIANHSEFVSVPENLVVLIRDKKFLRQTSLTAIGSIAMQGFRRANLSLGETVCVFGLGLIGQITVQLAKASGCKVIGVDLQKERLELAERLGCDKVLNPTDSDIANDTLYFTEHYGVDATIITAAANTGQIIDKAMEITRRKGKVVLVGDVKLDFSREHFYTKEIDFLISCSYGPGRYDNFYERKNVDYPYSYVRWTENRNMQLFVDLIEKEKVLIDPIISHEFEFEQAQNAYKNLKTSLGVVLRYQDKVQTKNEKIIEVKPLKDNLGKLRIALIGAGGFSKVKLLPILKTIKNAEISAIADVNMTNAFNVASQYGVGVVANNHIDLLQKDKCDMALIATPHALHASQAIDFLSKGKAVFLEKPAAVNFEEFNKLKSFLNLNNNAIFTVDFNRSFAPLIQSIKSVVSKRISPLVVTYRMNAGYLPKEHWIQSNSHGGRIIGEACHIFELFCFLTGAKPTSVSIGALHPKEDGLFSTDNFSAHISFNDGSLCSLLYTSVGSNALNKERLEAYFDGKSIIMDDYKELIGYDLPRSFNKKYSFQDKGHDTLLKSFIEVAINGGVLPISLKRIFMATELSLIIDKLASNGGGNEEIKD